MTLNASLTPIQRIEDAFLHQNPPQPVEITSSRAGDSTWRWSITAGNLHSTFLTDQPILNLPQALTGLVARHGVTATINGRSITPRHEPSSDTESNIVVIHTDGSCLGNPGPGGYCAITIERDTTQATEHGIHHHKESTLTGGRLLTTNNRMEITAALVGLQAAPQDADQYHVFSDSRYLVDAMSQGWARRWQANGWRRSGKGKAPVLNPDLWEQMLNICQTRGNVSFHWIKGHQGEPWNERCDQLARHAAHQPDLPPDQGYLNQQPLSRPDPNPKPPALASNQRDAP